MATIGQTLSFAKVTICAQLPLLGFGTANAAKVCLAACSTDFDQWRKFCFLPTQ